MEGQQLGWWEDAVVPWLNKQKMSLLEDYWGASRGYIDALAQYMDKRDESSGDALRGAAQKLDAADDALARVYGVRPKVPEVYDGQSDMQGVQDQEQRSSVDAGA